jgi:hypothetical protein
LVSRNDVLKIGVLVLVLAFLTQVFSFQGGGSYVDDVGGEEIPTPTPMPPGVLGLAAADATVSGYPQSIITLAGTAAGEDEELQQRLRDLTAEGQVAYFNSANPDNINIVLAEGADVVGVAWNITIDFPDYVLFAEAELALPEELEFETAQGNVSATLRPEIEILMEPLTPVGSNVSLVVRAMLVGEEVSEFQVQVAEKEGVLLVEGNVAELLDEWMIDAQVPWTERNTLDLAGLQGALNSTYPNSSVNYELNQLISVGEITDEERDALGEFEYVMFAVGGSVVIGDDFVNQTKAEEDFRSVLGENASIDFPASLLSINVSSGELNESFLHEATGLEELEVKRAGVFELGEIVTLDGIDYLLPGGARLQRVFPTNVSAGENFTHLVAVMVQGARVTAVQ